MLPLAQDDLATSDILVWSIVLLLFVLVLFSAVAILRRKLSPNEDFHGTGFTLSDLRQMHKKGQMSDAEFERAKAALLGSLKNMPAKNADAIEPKDLTPPG
jgi:hypothetical protein